MTHIDNADDEDDQHLFKAGSLVKGFLFCLVSRLEWEIDCNGNFFSHPSTHAGFQVYLILNLFS